jgi:hypothetical protein
MTCGGALEFKRQIGPAGNPSEGLGVTFTPESAEHRVHPVCDCVGHDHHGAGTGSSVRAPPPRQPCQKSPVTNWYRWRLRAPPVRTMARMDRRYVALPPRQALERVASLLAVGDTSPIRHRPVSMTCAVCASRWASIDQQLSKRAGADPVRLTEVLARMWEDGHRPSPDCSPCDGCWMELDEASRSLVLAHCGVHPYVGWGPGHTRAHQPRRNCSDCRSWKNARHLAETRLRERNFEPSTWLPPLTVATNTFKVTTPDPSS